MQYNWDRYRSICSASKCPLEITADDYFVTSNGAVYDAIQTAYIVLRTMGYSHVSCLPSTIILPAPLCLPICIFVHVSVCASVQLEIHSPENTNMITDVWALNVLHFILYIYVDYFYVWLKNMPVFIWEWWDQYVDPFIETLGKWVLQTKRAFWAVDINRCSLSFESPSLWLR